MLRGDLQTTPLADLLRQLADARATGCVYLLPNGYPSDGEESAVALRNGAICNVTVPGSEESVGTRLVASRRLDPAALAEARQAQETELANWMLPELLIHLGLADEIEVHDLVAEQALSDLSDLCGWPTGSWRFRRRQRWGASLPTPLAVEQVLDAVAERGQEWHRLSSVIRGADAVVSLAAHPADKPADGHADEHADEHIAEGSAEALEMDADGFALLCAVDGVRTVAQLGAAAGFTLLDAGRTIVKLVNAGLVQVALDAPLDSPDIDSPVPVDDRFASDEELPLDAIAAALTSDADGPLLPENVGLGFAPVGAPWQMPRTSLGDPLSDALARVSAALSEAMNDPQSDGQHPAAEVAAIEDEGGAIDVVEVADVEPEVDVAAEVDVEVAVEPDVVVAVEAEPEPVADVAAHDEAGLDITEAYAALAEAADVEITEPEPEPAPAPPPRVPKAPSHHDMAAASRLLSQLAGEPSGAPPAPAPPQPAEARPEVPADHPPRPRREDGLADTAALLRELSSLGTENNTPTAPRPTPNRPESPGSQGGQHARKRKGLFGGRG